MNITSRKKRKPDTAAKIRPGKNPENKTRKKFPAFEARKIWPEILRRKQSPEKAQEYIDEKIRQK